MHQRHDKPIFKCTKNMTNMLLNAPMT